MAKNDKDYILKSLEEIDKIINYSQNKTLFDICDNDVLLDSIVFRMIQMSEQLNNISIDLKVKHPEIEWIDIKGFRNRLVHSYGNVDIHFFV